jgi:membrane-bound inhibitor of C-type lysozyme
MTRTIVTRNKAAASGADGARGVYTIKTQWSHGGAARAVLKQARLRADS